MKVFEINEVTPKSVSLTEKVVGETPAMYFTETEIPCSWLNNNKACVVILTSSVSEEVQDYDKLTKDHQVMVVLSPDSVRIPASLAMGLMDVSYGRKVYSTFHGAWRVDSLLPEGVHQYGILEAIKPLL